MSSSSGLVFRTWPWKRRGHTPGHAQTLGQDRAHGRNHGQTGADQCERSRQGRTPVSGDQAPVWIFEGALEGTGEKHGASATHYLR